LLDVARETIEEMLSPEINETVVGELIVKGVFRTTKDELIIGGKVDKGKINPGLLVKIKQDNKTIETEIDNLQREKQDAKEVFEGEMCGLSLKTTKKIKINEGDKLEFFTREIKKRTLNYS
jgi:translation initiation factor IF-2